MTTGRAESKEVTSTSFISSLFKKKPPKVKPEQILEIFRGYNFYADVEHTDLIHTFHPSLSFYLLLLAEMHLKQTGDALQASEIFENAILHHAIQLDPKTCAHLSPVSNVDSNASFGVFMNGYLRVNYRNLTSVQVAEICAVYKSYYGEEIIPLVIDHSSYIPPHGLKVKETPVGCSIYFNTLNFARDALPHFKDAAYLPAKKREVHPQNVEISEHFAYFNYFKTPRLDPKIAKDATIPAPVAEAIVEAFPNSLMFNSSEAPATTERVSKAQLFSVGTKNTEEVASKENQPEEVKDTQKKRSCRIC